MTCKLQPFNGMSIFGNGADGVGPALGGVWTQSEYNFTSWAITGNILLNTSVSSGFTIRVMGNFSMTGAGNIQATPDAVGATDWGGATDGTWAAGGVAGAANGVTLDRTTIMSNQLFTSWYQAGYGNAADGSKGFGGTRLTLLVGGTVTIDATDSDKINLNGGGSASYASGGGGGGIVCIVSGTGITATGANYAVKAQGYNGRSGLTTHYGGGGGGGGAVIFMAPVINGITLSINHQTNRGSGGTSTFAGAESSGGGGGSFAAGGAGGSVAHPAGYDGNYGQVYSLLIPPIL